MCFRRCHHKPRARDHNYNDCAAEYFSKYYAKSAKVLSPDVAGVDGVAQIERWGISLRKHIAVGNDYNIIIIIIKFQPK